MIRNIFLALALALPAVVSADSWPAATVAEVFSASRDHFVRIMPGGNLRELRGWQGAEAGSSATAEFYQRQPDRSYRLVRTVTLLNPVAPERFFVSDQGYLITIDNWANIGYGAVIAVYDPQGQLVKAHTLADLFSAQEIDDFERSVSSIWWHQGPIYLQPSAGALYIGIAAGRDLTVEIDTGRYYFCETRSEGYRCRDSNAGRQWQRSARD